MAKEAYFFSHDSNARNDEKLIAVRMRHGAEGYGIYFMILERLLEASNYMSVKDYNVIAFDLRVAADKVKSVIEDFGLFEFSEDGKKIFSQSFLKRMQPLDNIREQRRQAGLKSAEKRAQQKSIPTTVQRPLVENPTKDSIVKYSIVKESSKRASANPPPDPIPENSESENQLGKQLPEKEKKSPPAPQKKEGGIFKPPTPEEVKNYCTLKSYSVDPNRFCDFYESKGWMVGRNKMKDWQAAVRNWQASDKTSFNFKNQNNGTRQIDPRLKIR